MSSSLYLCPSVQCWQVWIVVHAYALRLGGWKGRGPLVQGQLRFERCKLRAYYLRYCIPIKYNRVSNYNISTPYASRPRQKRGRSTLRSFVRPSVRPYVCHCLSDSHLVCLFMCLSQSQSVSLSVSASPSVSVSQSSQQCVLYKLENSSNCNWLVAKQVAIFCVTSPTLWTYLACKKMVFISKVFEIMSFHLVSPSGRFTFVGSGGLILHCFNKIVHAFRVPQGTPDRRLRLKKQWSAPLYVNI